MELIGTLATRSRNLSPVPYTSNRGGVFGNLFARGNRASQMEAFGSVGTLFAVVSAISEATAQQDWYMERVSRDTRRMYGADTPNRVQLLQHPALDLWNTPNPFMSRHDLVEISTQHLKLTGECYWLVATDPRFPTLPLELWPVRPDRMTPVPDRERFLAGYVYTSPEGEQVPLELSQVIQVKLPNPLDPYRGMGPVQALLADLDSVRYSAEWNRRFFLNDATPGGIIEMEDGVSDTEFNKIRERWYDQHRGTNNAHRVAFLTRAHWVQMAFSPRDMQFTQLREISSGAIREAFRIHKAILGQSDDVNRANADAADYQLAKWNVSPTLSRYRGALNSRLLPMYGTPVTTEFGYRSPVEEDAATEDAHLAAQTSAYATLVGAGVHPEDAAMTVGLAPMRPAITPAPPREAIPA